VRICRVVFLALVVLLACAVPALADQRWKLPAQTLSDPGQDATEDDLAVDANGNAVAVWTRFDGTNNRIQAAFRNEGGTFSAPQTISDSGQDASEPQVAVDPAGNAVAVWSRFDGTVLRIQAAYAPAGGSFGASETVSAAGSKAGGQGFAPQVSMSASGEAIVVWSQLEGANYLVQMASRPPGSGSSFGAQVSLSAAGQDAFDDQIDVAPDGNAVAVWYRFDGSRDRIQAATRGTSGSFGAAVNISPSGEDNFTPQVTVRNGGSATAVWYGSDGVQKLRVESASRVGTGSFGSVQTLSDTAQDAFDPQVDQDPSGNAFAVWSRTDGTNDRTQAAIKPTAGTFGAAQTLSDPGQNADGPQIDVDPNGNALAAWYRSDGTTTRIQAVARPAGGSFGVPETLSDVGRFAFNAKIDQSSSNAVAAWYRRDGVNWRVQAVPREEVYDTPRASNRVYTALVPSFRQTISTTQCTATGRDVSAHGAPLSLSSCNPPAFVPGTQAFFGPKTRGYVQYVAQPGDVSLVSSLTDLQNAADADYDPNPSGPELTVVVRLRVTDRASSSALGCSPSCPATMDDIDFSIPEDCVGNADPTTGSTCSVVSSFNAVMPGAFTSDRQTDLQVFRTRVNDSGANGTPNDSDDRNFAMQGIYIR
jgi:hypothetical protein